MTTNFTKLCFARAAVAMCYQFHGKWEWELMRKILMKFKGGNEKDKKLDRIRYKEEYDLNNHLPKHHIVRRDAVKNGRQGTPSIVKVLRKRLGIIRRAVANRVSEITGWKLLFPSMKVGRKYKWVYGRDEVGALCQHLSLKTTVTEDTWAWQVDKEDVAFEESVAVESAAMGFPGLPIPEIVVRDSSPLSSLSNQTSEIETKVETKLRAEWMLAFKKLEREKQVSFKVLDLVNFDVCWLV
jgi:hypothetical protein